MYDIIVVGAGPAGLTSAIYGRRALKKILVLEAISYGGQILTATKIDNYPGMPGVSGYEFATALYNQAINLGAQIKIEKVIDIKDEKEYKEVITNKNSYKCKALILAAGCDNRHLGIEREKELTGKGISYCATCDGNFYKEKNVAVAGGGNTALEDAVYLSDIAKKVYLIHRRDEFRGEKALVEQLKSKKNVEFVLNSNVTKLIGEDTLRQIEVTDKDKNKRNIEVSGLFIAVGKIPENENFKKIIKINDNGYIEASENCHTNVEGIFAPGDIRVKTLRQLVTAESDGAIAAMEAIKYINSKKHN